MRLIYTTRQLTQLSAFSLQQRQQILQRACQRLSVLEKWLLNLLKLAILIPAFGFMVNLPDQPLNAVWTLLILLAFPLLVRPIQCGLAEKYIKIPHKDEQDV